MICVISTTRRRGRRWKDRSSSSSEPKSRYTPSSCSTVSALKTSVNPSQPACRFVRVVSCVASAVCRVVRGTLHRVLTRVSSALAVLLLSQGKEHRPGPSFSFQAHDEGTPIYQLCFLGSNVLIRCVTGALPCVPRREPCPILYSLSLVLHPPSTTHHLHLHQRRREGDKGVGLGQTARQGRKQLAVFI